MKQASIFPERLRFLSGSGLKLLAIIAMLVDHSAICFAPLLGRSLFVFAKINFTPYVLLRGFGRIAFPIFCFLLAEGFRHTRSRLRYALSLLIFALLSELPYDLFKCGAFGDPHQNVFFTLLLGFLGIWAMEALRGKPLLAALAMGSLAVISYCLKADYGWPGYLIILLTYVLAEHPMMQLFSGMALLGWPAGVACAYPFMNFYNGERGFVRGAGAKYFFYFFYPVHLTILWLVHQHFFGY